jgi:Domain of unknown function (DUF5753)/Helix-turn-helix domain
MEVAAGVGWSPTKVSRAESGRESFPPEEVAKLLDYYGVADPPRGHLLGLAEDATQRGWWEDHAHALTPEYVELIGLEAEASAVAAWHSDVVPGLLQTAGYARQISLGYQSVIPTPPSEIDQVVLARMRRQERLTRDPRLQLSAVIDEAILLRQIGDKALMRDQLDHLERTSELSNVDLRILPLERENALIAPPFDILSFGTRADDSATSLGDIVNIESFRSNLYIEGETDTYMFRLFFQALTRAALSPEESRLLLRNTAHRAWTR